MIGALLGQAVGLVAERWGGSISASPGSHWRATGEVSLAVEALFELAAVLLLQGRGGLLSDLADRLLELSKHAPLPPGSYAKILIFAALMRKGAANPGAFFCLVHEQRRHRKVRLEHEEPPPGLSERDDAASRVVYP